MGASPWRTWTAALFLVVAPAISADEVLRNDGWEPPDPVVFQGGFNAGEVGASRLVPSMACPCQLREVSLLFGGNALIRTIQLHVWDDNGATEPGTLLYSGVFELTGSSSLHVLNLDNEGIVVDGPFRVGIELTASGLPSIAIDADGTIAAARNFIYSLGVWSQSSVFLSGDWIIRAKVGPAQSERVRVDRWEPGDDAGFQSAFVAGDMAAVRFTATLACPCLVEWIELLFGGSPAASAVTAWFWHDAGGSDAPGAPIDSVGFALAGDDDTPYRRDLSDLDLVVPQSFRLGIEFSAGGLPSVARDNDGTIDANRNFMFITGDGWVKSSVMGVSGDWIFRALLRPVLIFADGFASGDDSAWSAASPP